jgi:hypothetical protein
MGQEYFTLKLGLQSRDLFFLDPTIIEMLAYTASYSHDHLLSCTITSLCEFAPGRKSNTHKEGRAIDISIKGWNDYHIQTFLFKFKEQFKGRGAYNRAGENRPIVYHKVDGGAYHFHMQTHRRKDGKA